MKTEKSEVASVL